MAGYATWQHNPFCPGRGLVLAAAGTIDASMNNYTVRETNEDGVRIYVLRDAAKDVEVKVAPQFGNIATSMTAHGKAVLWTPYPSAGEWPASGHGRRAVPMAVANRIDGWSYWVNGRKYALNPTWATSARLPRTRRFTVCCCSRAMEGDARRGDGRCGGAGVELRILARAGDDGAVPVCQHGHDDLPAAGGVLEVETRVENLSSEPMPVALGFHPYFQVTTRRATNGKCGCRRARIRAE